MDYIEVYSQAAEIHFHANLSTWIIMFFGSMKRILLYTTSAGLHLNFYRLYNLN